MKLAIMQPYFFPYLGYFQLINAVNTFIIHDDVQYIKGGWINKNRILLQGSYLRIGIPVMNDSSKKKINERYFVNDFIKFKNKGLRQIENSYKKAPFFNVIFPEISRLLSFEERNVSKFNIYILSEICSLLKISTRFYISSEIRKENHNSGEERVININQVMGSNVYINSSGGVDLYDRNSFINRGIELQFIKPDKYWYKQFGGDFIPDLSIIDVLMFNSLESVTDLLNKCHFE